MSHLQQAIKAESPPLDMLFIPVTFISYSGKIGFSRVPIRMKSGA